MKNGKENVRTVEQPEVPSQIDLPEDFQKVIENLKPEERKLFLRGYAQMVQVSSFNGPIPHPETLKGYEEVLKGSADRIISMAEKEQQHRFDCDNKIISEETARAKRGQQFGCFLITLLIIASIIFAYIGYPKIAMTIAGVTILGIGSIFVLDRLPKKQNDQTADNTKA